MKTKLLFITALLFAMSEINAQVTLPYYEGFNYDIGESLVPESSDGTTGLGPWRVVNNTGTGSPDPIVVASPAWSLPANLLSATANAIQFQGGSADPSFEIPDQGTAGSIYASFIMRVTDLTKCTDTNGGFIFSFYKVTSTNGNSYTSTVYLKPISYETPNVEPNLATKFYIGIGETNSGWNGNPITGTPTNSQCKYGPTQYDINTDIFIVIRYDVAAKKASIWVNPVINGTEPAVTSDTAHDEATGARDNITYVRLSLESNARTPDTILDEIRVGNTWVSVTPETLSLTDEQISSFKVYPNPARDYVTIESPMVKITSVDMYSVLGKKVLSENTLVNDRLNVSTLSKGIYFMKINAPEGSVTKKVVIE